MEAWSIVGTQVNHSEIKELLSKLTGQSAQIDASVPGLSVLNAPGEGLGYSQLNELLLLFGFDRITSQFFRYLLDGKTEYEPGLAFESSEQLNDAVNRFRKLAILLFGNVKYGFKILSRDVNLRRTLLNLEPIADYKFKSRHLPILPHIEIDSKDTYLTGYLIERQIKDALSANPGNPEMLELEGRRLQAVETAKRNQEAYLASDHLDVYVATSMRERHEFKAINRITTKIFQHHALSELKLRWFDPTQAYCQNRIDKGLAEALMLRRASCTIYLAQESDTLGKDSELASTLAQGKPVVAYIPEVTDEYFKQHFAGLHEDRSPAEGEASLLLEQLRIYAPELAWTDHRVREWCSNREQVDVADLKSLVFAKMQAHFDTRARTLRDSHPLGIQINLDTGVSNGVLVVRSIDKCAELVRRIILQSLEFDLVESDHALELREKISDCVFRVMTKDLMLVNTFWNFYLKPAI
jgi:hypothetical protein